MPQDDSRFPGSGSVPLEVQLACHPGTPCGCLVLAQVRAIADSVGLLRLRYFLEGQISRLRLPPRGPSRRGHRLWEHTCFEAFLANPGREAYHEVNASPSGEWTTHDFIRYREGGPSPRNWDPELDLSVGLGHLELGFVIPLSLFEGLDPSLPLRLGLALVAEEADGRRSYWALRHPSARPDFHHAEAFGLELPPVGQEDGPPGGSP